MSPRPGIHAGHLGEYRHCQQPECVAHRARYHKRWTYERSHGLKRLIDGGPTRRHIDGLIGEGWSLRAIAGAASTSPTTVARIARGDCKIQRDVSKRILAVTGLPYSPSVQTSEPFISRVGTTRRLQALLFMGWTHEAMKAHSGLRTAVLLNQQGRWVLRSTHDRVEAMFAELAMTVGPSERTRARARKRGYVGPLDWDDIDRDEVPLADEPDELPARARYDEIVVERFLAGDHSLPTTRPEREEIVRRWTGSRNELERLGWKVERYFTRDEGDAA